MRNLLIIGLLIGGAFMAGWFTIEKDGDKTRIEIDRSEIRQDADRWKEKGRDFLDRELDERQNRARAIDEDASNDETSLDRTSPQGVSGFDRMTRAEQDRYLRTYDQATAPRQ